MVYLALFGVIASLAAFFCAVGKRRFEEGLPFSFFAIVLMLYVCGFTCGLETGVYVVLGVCAAAVAASVIYTTVHREWKSLIGRIVTPGLAVWVVLFVFAWVVSRNTVANTWDEFTHWADAVKVMYTLNDFTTNAASRSTHGSYPPAMALWQYMVQQVNILFGGQDFFEPLLYTAYQWFMLSLFMPFLKRLSWRKPLSVGFSVLVILLAATSIFPEVYKELFIDPFLGALGGFVLAYVLVERKPDLPSAATMCLALFTLVLTKATGILFAAAGILGYVLCLQPWKTGRKAVFCVLAALVALLIARGSWSLHVAVTGATAQESFQNPITIGGIIDVLSGKTDAWRKTTMRNFIYEMFSTRMDAQSIRIDFSYVTVLMMIAGGLVFLDSQLPLAERKPLRKITLLCYGTVGCYLVGACLTYMFKFDQDQAMRLSQYHRYLCAILMVPFFVLCALMLFHQYPNGLGKRVTALLLTAFLSIAPWTSLLDAVSGLYGDATTLAQADFLHMTERVRAEATQGDEQIYFITQDSGGFEYFIMRYRLRPLIVGNEPWSISAEGETTVHHAVISAKEWRQRLIDGGYDLVILHHVTETFARDYATVFANPDQIGDRQLYRMDPQTQMLVLVE